MARLPKILQPYKFISRKQCSSLEVDECVSIDGTAITESTTTSLRRRSSALHDFGPIEIEDADLYFDEVSEQDIHDVNNTKHSDPINLISLDYAGLGASYFSVGLMIGISLSLLYPILIVKGGATSSFMTASSSAVMIFWSYKILFGFLSDCFPIFGYKRKSYMVVGWCNCALILVKLATEGNNVDPRNLVIMLCLANLGYVWADTAADGFMVMAAHRETIEKRGKTQIFCYSMMQLGHLAANVIALFGFSGPEYNCPGYETGSQVPCTMDEEVIKRVDPDLRTVTNWCHEQCPRSMFSWDFSIPHFSATIFLVIVLSLALIFRLKEDKVEAKPREEFLLHFWGQLKRKAAWQTIMYAIISHILFGVHNAAKPGANFVWLGLSAFQQQIMFIAEKMAFFIGLQVVRRYALNVSWRKMIILGSSLVLVFNASYFLIIYDVWRFTWFYMATDVSTSFMYTLNVFVNLACMVEVAQPGYEAITYSLITAASNVVRPLSAVVSYQLLAFFPLLNEQENIKTDTPQVRHQFAALQALVIFLNLSSLLTLPLIPRQKMEARELVAGGGESPFWGKYVVFSLLSFLIYSSVVTFMTVIDHDSYGCLKILGGGGCTENESSLPALCLVSIILLYCYLTTFRIVFWPIVLGAETFSWRMFV